MRSRSHVALVLGLVGSLLVAGPVLAESPVDGFRASAHKEVSSDYFGDDICGPRSGWLYTEVSWHLEFHQLADGSWNVVYGETGTYHVDFDDPSIADQESHFTQASHATVTPGGTSVMTAEWRDFPGTIRIFEKVVFIDAGGEIRVDRDILSVDGCP